MTKKQFILELESPLWDNTPIDDNYWASLFTTAIQAQFEAPYILNTAVVKPLKGNDPKDSPYAQLDQELKDELQEWVSTWIEGTDHYDTAATILESYNETQLQDEINSMNAVKQEEED